MNRPQQFTPKRGFFAITTIVLSLVIMSVFLMGMRSSTASAASLGTSGDLDTVIIQIEKPNGWKTKETPIKIRVESNVKILKVEAKTANNGSFTNITDDMIIDISENCTVYVQVTDIDGAVHIKNRYIEIFDREAPTVKATITKNLLRVEANDNLSGVSEIYIDDEKRTDLINDTLDIRVRELGKEYAEISIQAVDIAGNKSKIVTVKNPNYKERASTEKQDASATASETKEQNGIASTTNATIPTTTTETTTPTASNISAETTRNLEKADNSTDKSSSKASTETPLFGTFEDTHKQFMTIVTSDGAVYYLIIDHDKESENVYLLSEVTNAELESFTPQGEAIEEQEEYPEFIGEKPKEEEIGFKETEKESSTPEVQQSDDSEESELPAETKKSSTGTIVFVIIVLLATLGAGYYFKIYKPKQELENADDLDEFEFAEDPDIFTNNMEEIEFSAENKK